MSEASEYYAVIFSAQQGDEVEGYAEAAERMLELAALQPGYLGVESARGTDGFGITVSYWQSLDAIAGWKRNAEHLEAQKNGRLRWYAHYDLRISRVEKAYSFRRG